MNQPEFSPLLSSINLSEPKSKNGLAVNTFFSGLGFLDLGFESLGFSVKTSNEVNPSFFEIAEFSRSKIGLKPIEKPYVCSIEDLDNEKAIKRKSNSDLIGYIGGPPCPDFSIAGKQRGHTGDHGKLTEIFFNLIAKNQPDWFLFENVKGLWKTKKHRMFFDRICNLAIDSGYSISSKLINALSYGAPQFRERIILVGFHKRLLKKRRGGILHPEEFPWEIGCSYDAEKILKLNWPTTNQFGERSEPPIGLPQDLMVMTWFIKNEVELHPNFKHCFKPRAGLTRFQSVPEGDDSRKSFKRIHRWRYSPTAAYGNNEVHLHPFEARRLNVAEALAIQSLPKEFQMPDNISLSTMFKGIGNGVPYVAAKGLASAIDQFIHSKI